MMDKTMFTRRQSAGPVALRWLVVALLVCASTSSSARDADPPGHLFKASMEELMRVKVTLGTLTGLELSKVPASVTIISREDIEKTPARNILDLLEVYVPGLMLFNDDNAGPAIMIRGLGNRNYKTLLLVNGRPVNQKAFMGSVVELQNWDMNDIERIEVLRGPGSVTYGPGAISGIINVVTKRGGALDGFKVGVEYNGGYDSKGAFLQYGYSGEELKIFAHLGIRATDGDEDARAFQATRKFIGYKGTDAFTNADGNPVMAYYKDYDGEPQIKAHLDFAYRDRWRLWMRYTNSGQVKFNATKRQYRGKREWEDSYRFQDRSFIAALENRHELSDAIELKSILSFDSEEYYLLSAMDSSYGALDLLQRRGYSFSESELFFRSVVNYQPASFVRAALGFEYSHDYLGAPWGAPDTAFIASAGGGGKYFSEDSRFSEVYAPKKVAEHNAGWSSNTYSLLGELSYEPVQPLTVIASARLDKNDRTDFMFSPRLAAAYTFNDANSVKAVWQRSLRMNTMMELYYLDQNGLAAAPEVLTTYQLIYDRLQTKNLAFQVSAYFNQAEVMSWTGLHADVLGYDAE